MKTTILFWLLTVPFQIFGQVKLSGTIIDINTNQPVEFATVYINGTTHGTITNSAGHYSLEKVIAPCEVIFSHVSYETLPVVFNNRSGTTLNVSLKPKKIEIDEVVVQGKTNRKKNLDRFKNHFLGRDYWGKNAVIENDSVLRFKVNYNANQQKAGAVEAKSKNELYNLDVSATGSLKISLPLLGYELYVDILKCSELYNPRNENYQFDFLGYYYFKPVDNGTESQRATVKANRLKAYYNSSQHFFRSLFEGRLKENGYYLIKLETDLQRKETGWTEYNFGGHSNYSGDELIVTGQKGESAMICYYTDIRGLPKNIKERGNGVPVYSELFIKEDTCRIRGNGTVPDNSMVIGPVMGDKRIGASLPGNYVPGE